MNKILVPVDFSVPSSWGYSYAYDLAKSIDAEVIVVHVYSPTTDPSNSLSSLKKMQEDAPKKRQEIEKHLKAATQVLNPSDKVKVTYIVDYGTKNDIAHYAKIHHVDLIIMGTHGAGNGVAQVWGSNTSNVIKNAHCPVLAVPKGAVFQPNLDIAYATDFDSKDIESISQLAVVTTITKSTLHCVHVNLTNGSIDADAAEKFAKKLRDNFDGLPVKFHTWSANNVEDGLEIFCRIFSIEVLAMLTHDKSTWEKMFGEKSHTRTMAMRNLLPLLAFHK
jgi:nucleotide-binding universal stress UspA family protein